MPYYNLTNVTNSSNLWELTDAVNTMSGGWMGIGILVTLTIILFISIKDYPMKEAFAATMFISTLAALLLRVLGIISDFVMFIYVILTAVSIITLLFNK